MKIEFLEHEGCFAIDLTAENLEEAATLTRFGMNRTKPQYVGSNVSEKGSFTTGITFAKNKRADGFIQKRK